MTFEHVSKPPKMSSLISCDALGKHHHFLRNQAPKRPPKENLTGDGMGVAPLNAAEAFRDPRKETPQTDEFGNRMQA